MQSKFFSLLYWVAKLFPLVIFFFGVRALVAASDRNPQWSDWLISHLGDVDSLLFYDETILELMGMGMLVVCTFGFFYETHSGVDGSDERTKYILNTLGLYGVLFVLYLIGFLSFETFLIDAGSMYGASFLFAFMYYIVFFRPWRHRKSGQKWDSFFTGIIFFLAYAASISVLCYALILYHWFLFASMDFGWMYIVGFLLLIVLDACNMFKGMKNSKRFDEIFADSIRKKK